MRFKLKETPEGWEIRSAGVFKFLHFYACRKTKHEAINSARSFATVQCKNRKPIVVIPEEDAPECAVCDGAGYIYTPYESEDRIIRYHKDMCACCDGTGRRKS